MRLEGKAVVITGAAKGIGRAAAKKFAAEGAKLVLTDLDESYLNSIAEKLRAAGTEVETVVANVADEAEITGVIDHCVATYGRIDAMCNNAGIIDAMTSLGAMSNELWTKVMSVNVDGVFYAMRHALNIMEAQEGGGVICNTASVAGLAGDRGGAAYTASKHAVVGLTRAAAHYYGPKGIRVNAVCPGGIKTTIGFSGGMPDKAGLKRMMETSGGAMPREGLPSEIADAMAWLCSDESVYVNGTCLKVDGGWLTSS